MFSLRERLSCVLSVRGVVVVLASTHAPFWKRNVWNAATVVVGACWNKAMAMLPVEETATTGALAPRLVGSVIAAASWL